MSQIGSRKWKREADPLKFCYRSKAVLQCKPGLSRGLHCQVSLTMKIPFNCNRYPNLSKSYSLYILTLLNTQNYNYGLKITGFSKSHVHNMMVPSNLSKIGEN